MRNKKMSEAVKLTLAKPQQTQLVYRWIFEKLVHLKVLQIKSIKMSHFFHLYVIEAEFYVSNAPTHTSVERRVYIYHSSGLRIWNV